MHKNRMQNISRSIAPEEGTTQRLLLEKIVKRDPVKADKYYKKVYKEALASDLVQMENGSGLPADQLIREFTQNYNHRVINYSLNDLPSSFNVVEAFNIFIKKTSTFKINKEKDCIFSFGDFLDYITSDNSPSDLSMLDNSMKEGVIYSFNSIDDPEEYLFSTKNGKEFGVLSISLVKYSSELSIILQTGQVCDIEKESEKAIRNYKNTTFLKGIKPDKSRKVEAVSLIKDSDLLRTIVLVRFDLDTSTFDARYILYDQGRTYNILSDDIASYFNMKGEFFKKEYEKSAKDEEIQLRKYDSLFDLCKQLVFLPLFRKEFEDVISIERHPTQFKENTNKRKYKRINKHTDQSLKILFRNVENITPSNRNHPIYREFSTPDFQVETSGYWKKLNFKDCGVDKNDQPIHGRTWVSKTLTWKITNKKTSIIRVKSKGKIKKKDHGYIYVMRNASHDKNIFKVGLTRRSSEERASELTRTTSSPDHFLVVEDWEVSDCVLAEKIIHERLDQYRVKKNREFFKVAYKVIFKVIDGVIDELQ